MGERPGERQIEELVGNQNPGPEAPPRSNKRAREDGAKEMSAGERWRNVGMSRSLRGRRSEEMIQSNTSSPRGSEVFFESQSG